jgi:hypothetical protein
MSVLIKSMRKSLRNLGLLLFVVGSLAVTNMASAQSQIGNPTSPFTLHNYVTGLCLAVQNNDTNPGGQLITWACNGTGSQLWFQGDPTADGSLAGYPAYTLGSLVFNCRGCAFLVAGVQNGDVTDGNPVVTWTEDPTDFGDPEGTDNQGWAIEFFNTFDSNGHACYQILNAGINRQTPYNLGVKGANPAEGTQIVVWQDVNSAGYPTGPGSHPDQLWCIY